MNRLNPSQVVCLRNISHELTTIKPVSEQHKAWARRIDEALSGICEMCAGAGEIGCLRHDGYDSEPCPECSEVSL
jgi:hypothetical protein